MPGFEHPKLILLALATCIAAAFPLRRFFFGEVDGSSNFGIRWYGLLGVLQITFLARSNAATRRPEYRSTS